MSDITRAYKFYNRDTNVGAEVHLDTFNKDAVVIQCTGEEKGYLRLHRSLLPDVVECILKLNEEGED